MKASYKQYNAAIQLTGIETLNKTLTQLGYKPIKTEPTILEDTPWIKNKEPFENRQNLYLRIVDLMKLFLRMEGKDFIHFANSQTNFGHLLNKLQNYRLHNPEFQLLFYLIKNNARKQIALYIRLRQEILTRCGLNTTKFSSVSLHNQSKNFLAENVELGTLLIDYNYWGTLAEIVKVRVSQDMLWWLSDGNRKIGAVELVKAFIWSQENEVDNPESSY